MSDLFRKKAVENYKEQFSTDGHITKLSFSAIILSFLFVLGVLLLAVWFMFDNIASTAEVTGLVYPTAGINKTLARGYGVISDINVSRGDSVNAGDIIAVIPDEELLNSIEEAIKNGSGEAVIEDLRQKYTDSSVIRAQTDGTVLDVANYGDFVLMGDFIASVAVSQTDSNERQILAFLPTSKKSNISEGCKVQVSPDYAPREKYGYINGYVVKIDNSIITKSDAQKQFNVYNIPNLLDEDESYIPVHINLLPNENSASGLDWSVSGSGGIDVETGTLCNISIIVSSNPPYKWLFGGGE